MSKRPDGGDLPPEIDLSLFSGWVTFADLPSADVPRGPGVYIVIRSTDGPPHFLDVSPAGRFNGIDRTEPADALAERWVWKSRLISIGKANAGKTGRASPASPVRDGHLVREAMRPVQ